MTVKDFKEYLIAKQIPDSAVIYAATKESSCEKETYAFDISRETYCARWEGKLENYDYDDHPYFYPENDKVQGVCLYGD